MLFEDNTITFTHTRLTTSAGSDIYVYDDPDSDSYSISDFTGDSFILTNPGWALCKKVTKASRTAYVKNLFEGAGADKDSTSSSGLSASDYTSLYNSNNSIGDLIEIVADNVMGTSAYAVAFSFGTGSSRLSAQLKINSYVSSVASTCKTIQSHTSKIIEILEHEPEAATALRCYEEADQYLKDLSSITSVSNLDELNDWVSTTSDMISCLTDGLNNLSPILE